jgi:hypothetical protein
MRVTRDGTGTGRNDAPAGMFSYKLRTTTIASKRKKGVTPVLDKLLPDRASGEIYPPTRPSASSIIHHPSSRVLVFWSPIHQGNQGNEGRRRLLVSHGFHPAKHNKAAQHSQCGIGNNENSENREGRLVTNVTPKRPSLIVSSRLVSSCGPVAPHTRSNDFHLWVADFFWTTRLEL